MYYEDDLYIIPFNKITSVAKQNWGGQVDYLVIAINLDDGTPISMDGATAADFLMQYKDWFTWYGSTE